MKSRFPLPRMLAASITVCLGAGAAVETSWGAPAFAPHAGATTQPTTQRYIVRYVEPALASYNHALQAGRAKRVGGIAAIPMKLKANGRMQLDAQSAQARGYVANLAQQQLQHQRDIAATIGRAVTPQRSFRHALNGAVMQLSAAEADKVARIAGVASVVPDRARSLADDVSTRFVGANAVWLGGTARDSYPGYTFPTLDNLFSELNANFGGFKGDGIVVGDIDTGYNSLSPSFQATDASGYKVTNPLGSGHYLGDCGVAGISLGGCNDKVIGVYDEVSAQYYGEAPDSVEDTQGHGSHTASTIAGNARTAGFPGFAANLSGLAPHANLVIYYACAPDPVQCQDSATAGSVDQAIEDGIVDVLNYSISGGDRPWNDPVSQAFLAAEESGIFIAAAAGNTGTTVPVPLPGTANHLEPWVTTVAATTTHGDVAPLYFSLTGPGTPPAATVKVSATEGTFDSPLTAALPATTPVVLSPQFNAATLTGTDGCNAAGGYPAGTFANAIALISRGTCGFAEKVPNAIAAGAVAVIISDNRVEGAFSPTVGPPKVSVPVFSVAQSAGLAMQTFLKANKNAGTASLGYNATRIARQADVLANFSLLGPGNFNVIKPDVGAPGVATLAAVANDGSTNGPNLVAFYDGTSMATPHITATGALVLGLHPDWTPMEVKSAIMMTSQSDGLLKANATSAADAFDVGAGRLQAFPATQAGLVLDESGANMTAAYPDAGGNPSSLNLASMQNSSCASSCTFTRTLRATRAGAWSVVIAGELGSRVTVTPANFSLAKNDTVDLTIKVSTAGINAGSGYHFASIVLGASSPLPTPSPSPGLHLPIAVAVPAASISVDTTVVDIPLNGTKAGSASLVLSNPGAGTMEFAPKSGSVQAYTWLSQLSGNYYGEPSVHYTGTLGAGDTDYYSADDFVLLGSDPVNLASIVAPGFSANHSLASFGSGLALHWRVYADAQGVPASDPSTSVAAAWSYDSAIGKPGVKVTADTISLDLAAAGLTTALPAGRYWLVVYPDLPCNDKGSGCTETWYWLNSWSGTGNTWAITAPGYDWYNGVQNLPSGEGLAMTITSSVPCSLPDWLSLSPPAGAVASGASTSVKFNANFAASSSAPPKSAFVCLATSYQEPSLGTSIPRAVIPVQVNAH
ncbi:MAG: S8 family serine peptidase [Rudaea sp.]